MGKPISECIQQLSGKDVDAVVKIAFKRRKYKGKQKKDEMLVRLVAIYNDEDEKHHIYITNIQKDVLNAKDIAKLYGARWDIELLFKELKSRYALDVLETKNVQIIEAFIWTSMLTLIVAEEFIIWSKTQQLILKKWLDIRSRVGVKYSHRRQQIC